MPQKPEQKNNYCVRLYEDGKTKRDQYQTLFWTKALTEQDAIDRAVIEYPNGIVVSCTLEDLYDD